MKESQTIKDAGTEAVLIRKCQAGDEAAWEELVSGYGSTVFNIALSMLGNTSRAEEAAQDVFIRLVKVIGKFNFQSTFKTWLHRVTVNICLDRLDASHRHKVASLEDFPPEEASFVSPTPAPSAKIEHDETGDDVRKLLGELPEQYRVLLVMREMEDMAYEEMAAMLGIPVGTVESRLFRARTLFRQKLQENGWSVRKGGAPTKE